MINIVGKRLLVLPDEVKTETESGIALVLDEKLERHSQVVGTLKAVGHLAWKDYDNKAWNEPWARVGDKVLYSKYSGKNVLDPETGVEYIVMNDVDVIAVVTDGN